MVRKLDKYLVINIALLGIVSSVFIHSTVTVFPQFGVSNHGFKQAFFYILSFVVLIIMTNVDFNLWVKFRWYIYTIFLVLLLILFLALLLSFVIYGYTIIFSSNLGKMYGDFMM